MYEELTELFEQYRNEDNANQMERYMKNHFSFLGIKSPERKKLTNLYFQETKILKQNFDPKFVKALWNMEEREYQYVALDYIERSLRNVTKDDIKLMEYLITTKSWWDTVDMLAQKPIGKIMMESPVLIEVKMEQWSIDVNMWLRRTAILFQLKYKEKTNASLLYDYILRNADSKEFFIQKAIGWALREYSKTNPESVRNFIQNHELAKLSIREGSKYL
ncbi:DNA alkylation repair protein [Ornithinibacillus californiensis]|uniref:DNA alkylation repair protein n=1 Tax=Ornithinibacillus californiensis TaxID=161536 RepID=UPI00064D7497|nr:DNA alkylation repair protein [Ornithinibacillus californiensis]